MQIPSTTNNQSLLLTLWTWFDLNIIGLGREFRLSYLPPLMVYAAAGIQGRILR